MSKPVRQHFVPQMVLRPFGDSEERIWQLRVGDDSEPVQMAIEKVAVVMHYYTLFRDRPHKAENVFWEELFAEWEGKAREALDGLEQAPNQLRAPAALLVFFQLLRTPVGQTLLADQARAERERVFGASDDQQWLRWWVARKKRIPDLHEFNALREAARATRRREQHPLLAIDTTTILDELGTVLLEGFGERLWDEGHWNTLNDAPGRFIIGDEPVTYRGLENPARAIWQQEALPEVLTMPVSPRVCLEVRRENRHGHVSEEELEAINLRTVEWATRFIYGPDPQELVTLRELWQEVGCPSPPPRSPQSRRRR